MKKIIDMELPDEDPRKYLRMKIEQKPKRKNSNESDSDEKEDREYTSNQLFKYRHWALA